MDNLTREREEKRGASMITHRIKQNQVKPKHVNLQETNKSFYVSSVRPKKR